MRTLNPSIRALVLAGAGLALAGCVSLLPKSEPAQMYRFEGAPPASETAATPTASRVGVMRAGGSFSRAAAGDRILTVNGGEAAYLAQSRWIAPAITLFDEAVARAFDRAAGPARLVSRGEAVRAAYALRIDVTRFEAIYDQGAKAAPRVVVSLRVALARNDRTLAGEQVIEVDARASDNRVSAIVAAFDQAVGKAMAELTGWVNRTVSA